VNNSKDLIDGFFGSQKNLWQCRGSFKRRIEELEKIDRDFDALKLAK